jgi:hypothetical protein
MDDSVFLRLFQRTLTGSSTKWYVDKTSGSHATFESLAKAFFSFFQLPVHHNIGLEILSEFEKTTAINIADHIHEWQRRRSLCEAETTKEQCLDWFLKLLISMISKDVTSTFPQSEEEAINKAQQFDLIYSQFGYLYTIFPDAPRPLPFGQDKPGVSHTTDGLIGSMTHHNPYIHPSSPYGENRYMQPYGGTSYYPPPTHQQSYHVGPSQMLGEPPLVTMMHLVSQPSTISPPTPAYNPNSGGSTSTSYTPYGSSPQNNPYFPFWSLF